MFTIFLQSSYKLVIVDGSGIFNNLSYSVSLLSLLRNVHQGLVNRDLKEGAEFNGVIN